MAPADSAAAQFTRQPRCQGQGGFCHSAGIPHPPPKGEREGTFLPSPPPPRAYQLLRCLFKGEGRKKKQSKQEQNLKRKKKRSQTWDEKGMFWGKGKFTYFFICPVTALSSAALAEIPIYVLAFSLLLYCKRVIRII